MPQRSDGPTIEPSVSVPMAKPASPAATAAAEPALEPLAPSAVFHGLRVLPPNQVSPNASAPSVSLAISTAPASVSRATTAASRVASYNRILCTALK